MNLVLVGFMASGKTAVGRRLAKRLGYAFLDTDTFIESELGCTVSDIFSIQGEAYFRTLESRLAGRLCKLQNTIIPTGGGLPITPGNMERLKAAGRVVFLKADLEDILERLQRDSRRPMVRQGLKQGNLRETVARLLGERLPIYEQSDLIVETHGKSMSRVCGEIIRRAAEQGAAETKNAPAPTLTVSPD